MRVIRFFFAPRNQSKIGEAQGVIEGPWAEAAETRNIGPPVELGPAGIPIAGSKKTETPAVWPGSVMNEPNVPAPSMTQP